MMLSTVFKNTLSINDNFSKIKIKRSLTQGLMLENNDWLIRDFIAMQHQ